MNVREISLSDNWAVSTYVLAMACSDISLPPETLPKGVAMAGKSPPLPVQILPPCLIHPSPSGSTSITHALFSSVPPSLRWSSSAVWTHTFSHIYFFFFTFLCIYMYVSISLSDSFPCSQEKLSKEGGHSRRVSTSPYPNNPSLPVQTLPFYKHLFHACTLDPRFPIVMQGEPRPATLEVQET